MGVPVPAGEWRDDAIAPMLRIYNLVRYGTKDTASNERALYHWMLGNNANIVRPQHRRIPHNACILILREYITVLIPVRVEQNRHKGLGK